MAAWESNVGPRHAASSRGWSIGSAGRARPAPPRLPQGDADRGWLAAMAHPRRLDQIWPLARTPRFRLLAFVHFLRSVDAVDTQGVVEPIRAPMLDPRRIAALALLGVDHT